MRNQVINVIYLRTMEGWGFKCVKGDAKEDPDNIVSLIKEKIRNGKNVPLIPSYREAMYEANQMCVRAEKEGRKIEYNIRTCFDLNDMPRDDNQLTLKAFS